MKGLIDIHSHVLPALDDGALDLEDSVAMALQGEADGIELICATPHIRHDHEVEIADLARRVTELNAELERRSVRTRVVAGGEVAQTAVAQLSEEDLALVALGGEGGRWILLEPAPGPLGAGLLAAAAELAARGYRPLIAHPERHPSPELRAVLTELVRGGALVQMTAALLAAGGPAAQGMLELARHGLVHVLGSDSHSSRAGRPLQISEGLKRLAAAEPLRPHLGWISHTAPRALLGAAPIEPPYPAIS